MFTEQKWNILKCLSTEKLSPLQLSQKLNTTMANVSQQLRLLEASALVQKEKIKNREKGKPRTLFSLSSDFVYMIPAMGRFSGKKLFSASSHHRSILRIWFLTDEKLQYPLEKLYWSLQDDLASIAAILVDENSGKATVVSDNKKIMQNPAVKEMHADIIPVKSRNKLVDKTIIFENSTLAA